jgi:uncharacterized protein YjiS (DUF1127 family)
MARFTEMEKMAVNRAKAAVATTELTAGESVRHFAASIRRRFANRARRNAVTRELMGLSNRMLDDLGMTRADIAATAKLTADRAYPVNGSVLSDLRTLVDGTIVRPAADFLARREVEASLRSLDDRMLADVGLTRADIPAVVRDAHRAPKLAEAGFDTVDQIRVYNRTRIAAKQLGAYDDRMLDDMGFVRGDIQWVAKKLATRSVAANLNSSETRAA